MERLFVLQIEFFVLLQQNFSSNQQRTNRLLLFKIQDLEHREKKRKLEL